MDWQNGPDNRQQEQNNAVSQPQEPASGQPIQGGWPPQNQVPQQPVQNGWPPYGQAAPQGRQPPMQGQNPPPAGYYNPYRQPSAPVQGGNPYYGAGPQGGWMPPYAPPPAGNYAPYGNVQPPLYQNRYVHMPAQQAPADPAKPLAVMAARRVTWEQYSRLNNANAGVLTGVQVVLALVILIFSALAVWNGWNNGDMPAFIVSCVLTGLSFVLVVARMALGMRKRRKQLEKAYACALESDGGDCIVELYADRAESISARGRCVVRYGEGVLLEYTDMLVLMGTGAAIVWRAEDVSAAQMQAIQALVYTQVRPGMRRVRGVFYPRAYALLPLPVVENNDEVRLAFHIPAEKPLGGQSMGRHYGRALALLLPLLAIWSVYMANTVAITPSILLDLLIFLLISWAAGALLLLLAVGLVHSLSGKKQRLLPASYAFTRDGLARQWGGGTLFVPASRVIPLVKSDCVQLDTPYGRMKIRWEDVQDREELKNQLGNFGPRKAGVSQPREDNRP